MLATAHFDHLLCGVVDQLEEQLATPFTFAPYHRQITEPFDYYRYGVEFLRPLMARRANRPAHFYPMALATYDFLPPPETVQVELGEARRITRAGIHMAVGARVDMERFPGSDLGDKHARREARARHIWQRVSDDYAQLRR